MMQIELVGGPGDGVVVTVADSVLLWIVQQPAMSASEFVTMSERPDLIDFASMKMREHAYGKTERFGNSGARMFEYVGERVVR